MKYMTQPYLYIKIAARTPAKVNPKSPLTPVEMAPPPLEGDSVLVEVGERVDELVLVDEGELEPELEGG